MSISTKGNAYLAGTITDFEKVGSRSPKEIRPGDWQVDDPIGSTWGYTTDEKFSSPASILGKLIDTVSKGGSYLLNISPDGEGAINEPQQRTLLGIGRWLEVNGEAVYDTAPWTSFSDGPRSPIRFTTHGDTLYAVSIGWPKDGTLVIKSLPKGIAVTSVNLLGNPAPIPFTQDEAGMHLSLPTEKPNELGAAFRISGAIQRP